MKPSAVLCLVALAAALAGCGSGSDSTESTAAGGSRFYHGYPGEEATGLHISRSDCRALAVALEKQVGRTVQRSSDPTPPNSHCRLQGRGVHVTISLDAAYRARERYENRMTEQVQFNAAYPDRVPQAVPDVGDPGAHNHYASWIPAYSTLFAVRGNRWLTVPYAVAGKTRPQRLAGATALARLAFKLTAR
ncbi:MAG: hypothetical protein ACTHN7_06040 [Solirubrobacterales bacterium]